MWQSCGLYILQICMIKGRTLDLNIDVYISFRSLGCMRKLQLGNLLISDIRMPFKVVKYIGIFPTFIMSVFVSDKEDV